VIKVLVTGGAGFIGIALVNKILRESDWSVVVVDKLTYASSFEALAAVDYPSRFAFERADIVDAAGMHRIFAAHRPDTVINLAAESHVDRSIDEPAPFIDTNVRGTGVLLVVSLAYWRSLTGSGRKKFRFHHVSTDEVFGSAGGERSFRETSRFRPSSPYSASKAAADHLVSAWNRTYGLPTIITRSSNNFGPYQIPEKLIPLTITRALQGKSIPVYGNGLQARDWLFVEDHVDALLAVHARGRVGRSYNVASGKEMRNIDVVVAVCGELDRIVTRSTLRPHAKLITHVDDRPGHDARYAISTKRIKDELSWQPRTSFDAALTRTVAWYIDKTDWWQRRLREGAHERRGLGWQSVPVGAHRERS